jgi:transcriptional regulator with XRE-family HTH domain
MSNKGITDFDELLLKLKNDVDFQKVHRRKKPYYDILSEVIRRRKELDITQEELAQKAGIPQSNIARLESGEHNLKLSTLIQIAEALESKLEIQLNPIYYFDENDYVIVYEGSTYRPSELDYSKSEILNEENEVFSIKV